MKNEEKQFVSRLKIPTKLASPKNIDKISYQSRLKQEYSD